MDEICLMLFSPLFSVIKLNGEEAKCVKVELRVVRKWRHVIFDIFDPLHPFSRFLVISSVTKSLTHSPMAMMSMMDP